MWSSQKNNEDDRRREGAPVCSGTHDESFSTIQSQILALDPLPSIDKIFNMVQQEQNHRSIMVARDQRNEIASASAVV